MNQHLRSDLFGPLVFSSGLPSGFAGLLIPQAVCSHAQGSWGTVCLQELQTGKFLLRYFLFRLHRTLTFRCTEAHEGLQSLLSLRGELECRIGSHEPFFLKEKEFTFLDAGGEEAEAIVPGLRTCSLFNAYYTAEGYAALLPLFPDFFVNLKQSERKPFHFLLPPRVARFTVHDAIQALWLDRYVPALEKKHVELRMELSLFTLLAQTYTESPTEPASALEREKAAEARAMILKDISVHIMPEDIAASLLCSVGWLKKAFRKVYGVGMFQFLRRTRMEVAREMLLRGESLKAAALEVGMQPQNFPKEFKAFYGYSVTDMKKGLY